MSSSGSSRKPAPMAADIRRLRIGSFVQKCWRSYVAPGGRLSPSVQRNKHAAGRCYRSPSPSWIIPPILIEEQRAAVAIADRDVRKFAINRVYDLLAFDLIEAGHETVLGPSLCGVKT